VAQPLRLGYLPPKRFAQFSIGRGGGEVPMDERVVSILGSDAGSQQQFLDTFRRSEFLTPEKSLLSAILEDAIHVYRKYRHAKDRLGKEKFREAQEWIRYHGTDWIFTFDNVCDLLGLNPNFVRHSLRQLNTEAVVPEHRGSRRPRHRRAA
jgi:hypothetical protein